MDDRSWANSVLSKLDAKMTYGVQKAQTLDGIPYTVQGSEWKSNGIGWWTNGFWPAEMWQMYLATGKELYRAEALRAETLMDEALKNFTRLHHDVGFLTRNARLDECGEHPLREIEAKRALQIAGHVLGHDAQPFEQMRDYLGWLAQAIRAGAESGQDMTELFQTPIPPRFAGLALVKEEFRRSVVHLFPAAEQAVLETARTKASR